MEESYQKACCDEVLIALRRITRAIAIHSKKLRSKVGLTGPQAVVLKEVLAHGELLMGQLAHEVSLSQATVTSIIGRLEQKGLVTRVRSDKDRRKVYVKATEEGESVFSGTPSLLQESFLKKFTSLEDWEQSLIIAGLQRVANMMMADDIDAAPFLTVEPNIEQR